MIALWIAVVLVAFLYFLLNLSYYKRRYEKLKAIPHPPGYFLVGNTLDLGNPYDVARNLVKWTKKYGGIYRLFIGNSIYYIVSDPGLLEFVTTKSNNTIKGKAYKMLHSWIGQGLITADGEIWRKRRKIITPTFNIKILEDFIEIFNKHTDGLLEQFNKITDGPSFDIEHYMLSCSLDIICETAMGVTLHNDGNKFIAFREAVEALKHFVVMDMYSMIKSNSLLFYFKKACWDLKRNLRIAHEFTEKVIETKRIEKERRKMTPSSDEDEIGGRRKMIFLDLLLEAEIDGRPWDDIEIRQEVDTFVVAGHDTTAVAMCYVLYCLSLYPQIQRKTFEEVDSILEGDKGRIVTYAHCMDMRYLELVLKETMRMYPVVPTLGREIIKDFEYGGYTFFKGSTMILDIYGVHMDPKNFKDPEVFDPERWLDNNYGTKNMFSYLPFGAGSRICIGQKYAMLEMKVILAKILMNYEILPPEEQYELKLTHQVVLTPLEKMMLRLKYRDV